MAKFRRHIRKRHLTMALVTCVLCTHVGQSQLVFDWGMSIQFQLRSYLDLDPKLDDRLKIYVLDESTVERLGYDDLALADWGQVILNLARSEPSFIVLDKTFQSILGGEGAREFSENIRQALLMTPVATGIGAESTVSNKDTTRFEDMVQFVPRNLVRKIDPDFRTYWWVEQLPTAKYLLGPHHAIFESFRHFGHVNLAGKQVVKPFYKLKNNSLIPHLGLAAGQAVDFQGRKLIVNDTELPLMGDGNLVINLGAPKTFYEKSYSFWSVISRSRREVPIREIAPGDVVLYLAAPSSNANFQNTYAGRMPKGFLLASIINSSLTGKWLRVIEYYWLACLLGCVLGMLVSKIPSLVWFYSSLGSLVLGISFLSIYSFCYLGVSWPFIPLTLSIALCAMVLKSFDLWVAYHGSIRLQSAFGGLVPKRVLDKVVSNQLNDMHFSPQNRIVTIMFLDIVGFSRSSEQMSPRRTFDSLSEVLGEITKMIHSHSGVVDKFLGDGMLAVFGHPFVDSERQSSSNHADEALACAVEVQRQMAKRATQQQEVKGPVWALRIGINTSPVFMGDLGADHRFDFTLIGDGVNYAKRLESSCENFHIMIGKSSMDLVDMTKHDGVSHFQRHISIKHFDQLYLGYELNPFSDNKTALKEAAEAYREFMGQQRRFPRHPVPEQLSLIATIDSERYRVSDFSREGMAIIGSKYFAPGVIVDISIETGIDTVDQRIQEYSLQTFSAEIRWGRPHEDRFMHGLRHRLTASLLSKLESLLFEAIESQQKSA